MSEKVQVCLQLNKNYRHIWWRLHCAMIGCHNWDRLCSVWVVDWDKQTSLSIPNSFPRYRENISHVRNRKLCLLGKPVNTLWAHYPLQKKNKTEESHNLLLIYRDDFWCCCVQHGWEQFEFLLLDCSWNYSQIQNLGKLTERANHKCWTQQTFSVFFSETRVRCMKLLGLPAATFLSPYVTMSLRLSSRSQMSLSRVEALTDEAGSAMDLSSLVSSATSRRWRAGRPWNPTGNRCRSNITTSPSVFCRNSLTSRRTGSSGPTRIRSWFTQNLFEAWLQIHSFAEDC